MTRFTFIMHSRDGVTDSEQIDLPDVEAARREALQACGDFLREIDGLHSADAWEMEVVGGDGARVCVLKFSAEFFTRGDGDGRESGVFPMR